MKNIAIILCGAGHLDGSEIRESIATLWALSQKDVKTQCFAPDESQKDVMNFLTSTPVENETRNQLQEAARIARGEILPLSKFNADDFDALIIPGGFGAAKNLSSFATEGSKGSVLPALKTALEQMHPNRKPLGAICIAPAILALTFQNKDIQLTLGKNSETSAELEKTGNKHIVCAANGCVVDTSFKMVTTPAYMMDTAPLHEIFTGIQKLVYEVIQLTE